MKDTNALLPDIMLRFNIEHPDLEECYAQGYESARAQLDEEANPFTINSTESEQWLEGWWAGFYEEDSIYELSEYLGQEKPALSAKASNDHFYENLSGFFIKAIELTSVFVGVALVGYQVIELVA